MVSVGQGVNDQISKFMKVPLGDPFIMLWDGKYYAYGTNAKDGIVVYISEDLLK